MIAAILIGCVLFLASPALAQPATPCTPLSSTTYTTSDTIYMWRCAADGQSWIAVTYGGGSQGEGVPAGMILFIKAGTCPTGYEEDADLNGKTIIGTVAANKDVGTTGGSDTITPEGTVTAPTFTGTPFTDVINHTHPVTDPGHAHVENQNSATTGGLTGWAARDTSTNTSSATGYSTASSTTGVTTANPAGGVAAITPAGTNSAPAFTGTPAENRSAFVRLIACRKT